jgi:hypothetical protein
MASSSRCHSRVLPVTSYAAARRVTTRSVIRAQAVEGREHAEVPRAPTAGCFHRRESASVVHFELESPTATGDFGATPEGLLGEWEGSVMVCRARYQPGAPACLGARGCPGAPGCRGAAGCLGAAPAPWLPLVRPVPAPPRRPPRRPPPGRPTVPPVHPCHRWRRNRRYRRPPKPRWPRRPRRSRTATRHDCRCPWRRR